MTLGPWENLNPLGVDTGDGHGAEKREPLKANPSNILRLFEVQPSTGNRKPE